MLEYIGDLFGQPGAPVQSGGGKRLAEEAIRKLVPEQKMDEAAPLGKEVPKKWTKTPKNKETTPR